MEASHGNLEKHIQKIVVDIKKKKKMKVANKAFFYKMPIMIFWPLLI